MCFVVQRERVNELRCTERERVNVLHCTEREKERETE